VGGERQQTDDEKRCCRESTKNREGADKYRIKSFRIKEYTQKIKMKLDIQSLEHIQTM
jgi:hypothetical protein